MLELLNENFKVTIYLKENMITMRLKIETLKREMESIKRTKWKF